MKEAEDLGHRTSRNFATYKSPSLSRMGLAKFRSLKWLGGGDEKCIALHVLGTEISSKTMTWEPEEMEGSGNGLESRPTVGFSISGIESCSLYFNRCVNLNFLNYLFSLAAWILFISTFQIPKPRLHEKL
jgi:hypothetical protein